MSRAKQLSVFVATAGLVATAAAIYYPHTRAAATQHNMMLAREHIEAFSPVLKADGTLGSIHLDASPADGGSILISGTVLTSDDLENLRRKVNSSNPPVPIRWNVDTILSTTQPTAL